jgi:hypothetical protein
MTRRIASRDSNVSLDPRTQFAAAWVAAFLGVALIVAVVFWAMMAYR